MNLRTMAVVMAGAGVLWGFAGEAVAQNVNPPPPTYPPEAPKTPQRKRPTSNLEQYVTSPFLGKLVDLTDVLAVVKGEVTLPKRLLNGQDQDDPGSRTVPILLNFKVGPETKFFRKRVNISASEIHKDDLVAVVFEESSSESGLRKVVEILLAPTQKTTQHP